MDGFKKYFNSTTLNGRANVAKATYASFALLYLYYRFKKKKTPPAPASPPQSNTTTTSTPSIQVPNDSPERKGCYCQDDEPLPTLPATKCDNEDQYSPLPELSSKMQDFTADESNKRNIYNNRDGDI